MTNINIYCSIFISGEKGRVSVQSIIGSQELPANQSQLPAREMADSYEETCIPLGSDIHLREEYLNVFQMVRYSLPFTFNLVKPTDL